MTRLIVCCDGTWNTASQEENNLPAPTNVVKLYNALAPADDQGVEQRKYYHPGIGTDGSLSERVEGGMFGEGLDRNIKSGWEWLARNFKEKDSIHLFGFSRGAYTARCIGGLLGRYGLPVLDGVSSAEGWSRIDTAYHRGYMDDEPPAKWLSQEWPWLPPDRVGVEFVGVWDTVGALGIPDDFAILNLFDNRKKWEFYDTTLGKHVKHARHAVAIDELRASFTPTLWTDDRGEPIYEDARVQQMWFPGVHSDVGGGYSSSGLSDVALDWMVREAAAKGLLFDQNIVSQIQPLPLGVLHDSLKGVFKAMRSRPRNIPNLDLPTRCHESARTRRRIPPIAQAPYHRTRTLKKGEQASIPIYANLHWNETDLYLEEKAEYRFSAVGEWLDRTIPSDAAGMDDGKFHPGEIVHMIGTAVGKLENLWHKVSKDKQGDFIMTRRVESAPWFSLVGIIANDGLRGSANPEKDGSPSPHEILKIGKGPLKVTIRKPGYLYAYANDAWHFYDNNKGSVQMLVERLS